MRYTFVDDLASYLRGCLGLERQYAGSVGRILRGLHPGGFPIEQPQKFDLMIQRLALAPRQSREPRGR